LVWYVQVLPTVTGKEIDPVGTDALELAFGVVTGLALAVPDVPVAIGTVLLVELLPEALHPARAATAATARAAPADPNLLICCLAL
jgi:hypothetical protein